MDEATRIILAADTTGTQTEKHQKRMMGEIAKLLDPGDGKLDPADYERTVSVLLLRRRRSGHHQAARRGVDP